MRVLMVCLKNPRDGLKGDTKLVKKRREVLEGMECRIDVLYFKWSWHKSSVSIESNETRSGIDIVVQISALQMVCWLMRANSVVRNEPVQTWVSFGIADLYKKRLEYVLRSYENIHFVHIRSVGLWRMASTNSRVIIDLIDSYTLNIGNRISKENCRLRGVLLKAEYRRIKKMEANIEDYVINKEKSTIVAVAETDIEHIGAGSSERVVVPVGVDRKLLEKRPRQVGKIRCVFFGNLDYEPNIRACEVIVCTAKLLRRKGLDKEVEITVAGRNVSYSLKRRLLRERIKVVSPVEDMYKLVKEHNLAIMPMVSGSGMQSKVLEAIAWGVVVLTTERSAKPVGLIKDSEYIRIRSAEDIVERLVSIMNGEYDIAGIRERAHKKIEEFEWEATCRKLLGLYSSA